MARKSAIEPIQDGVASSVQAVDIDTVNQIVQNAENAQKSQRKEELELILEGIRAVKQRILVSAQDQIKKIQEAIEKDTANLDNLAKKYTEEYKQLVEKKDDKNS